MYSIRFPILIGSLTIALLTGWSPPATAVKLSVIDQHHVETRNGEPVEGAMASRVLPDALVHDMITQAIASGSKAQPEGVAIATTESVIIALIEPEGGEAEGDVVCFTYSFAASVATSVNGDHAAASASTGRDLIVADGEADESVPVATAETEASNNYILVEGLDGNDRQVGAHSALLATGDMDDDLALADYFIARIGDTLNLNGTALSVAAVIYPGEATATASSVGLVEWIDCTDLPPVAVDISADGLGQIPVSPEQSDYFPGDEITLTATPDAGWRFVGWNGDAEGDANPLTIVLEHGVEITGEFEQSVTVDVSALGQGSISIAPEQAEYFPGDEITLTATVDEGWSFSGWSGDAGGSDNPLTFVLEGDVQITGIFTQILSVPVMSRPGSWLLILTLLAAGLWYGRASRQRARSA